MKTILRMLFSIAAFTTNTFAQEVLRPIVAKQFGNPVTIQGKFVAKPNTYYAQNLVKESFILEVSTVDGAKLEKPVLIEYKIHMDDAERTRFEKNGSSITVEAYESVYEAPSGGPWLAEMEQGHPFSLINVLHIRPIQKKQKKG